MDTEPAFHSRPSLQIDDHSKSSHQEEIKGIEVEDPIDLSGPSFALFGLVIAIASVAIPLVAVVTDRPLRREKFFPNALETDGSKSALPLSRNRISQPDR